MARLSTTAKLIPAAVTVTASETVIGYEIGISHYDHISFGIKYTKGDETKVTFKVYFRYTTGGTNYQYQTWSAAAGTKTATLNEFDASAVGANFINLQFDVRGYDIVLITMDATGGTPTGVINEAWYCITGD